MAVLLPEPNKLCFLVWQTRVKNTIINNNTLDVNVGFAPLRTEVYIGILPMEKWYSAHNFDLLIK